MGMMSLGGLDLSTYVQLNGDINGDGVISFSSEMGLVNAARRDVILALLGRK